MSRIEDHRSRKFLGALLRQYREAAGKKQEELAYQLGVPQSFISKCESGERRVDVSELKAICDGLKVPLSRAVHDFEKGIAGS